MSINGGPNIVRDGLKLYLDAHNIKSYPQSGNTWYNISSENVNGTLYNSPTFENNVIIFDGLNDYGTIPNSSGIDFTGSNPSFTMSVWVKPLSLPSMLISYADYLTLSKECSVILRGNSNGRSGIGLSCPAEVNFSILDILLSGSSLYIGGYFNSYKGVESNSIIKLNSDGSKDTSFDNSTGFNDTSGVHIITEGLFVGGDFTTYKGVSANRIIKLNTDGSKDTSFDNSTGFNATVRIITIDSSGKLYVGGDFTTYKGVAANRIIKLNADGTKDTSFDNSTGFDGIVRTIKIDSSGKLYVGGDFTTYKGVSAYRIIKLNTDGSKDTSFTTGINSFNNSVYTIAIDSSDKLYVGGNFTIYSGSTEIRIIKLNSDGTKDTSFDNTTGFDYNVQTITINGSDIYVGGFFGKYKGETSNRLVKLDVSGNKVTSFNTTTGIRSNSYTYWPTLVYAIGANVIKISSDKIYIGGAFHGYNNLEDNNLLVKIDSLTAIKDTSFDNSSGFLSVYKRMTTLAGIRDNSMQSLNRYTLIVGNWYNLVFTHTYANEKNYMQLYINGALYSSLTSTTLQNLQDSATYYLASSNPIIGGNGSGINMSISNCMIYNRILTSSEILQNYNILKSRFGL